MLIGPGYYMSRTNRWGALNVTYIEPRLSQQCFTRFYQKYGTVRMVPQSLSVRAPRHRDHPFHAIVITHSTAS